jgi:hypothetical protein
MYSETQTANVARRTDIPSPAIIAPSLILSADNRKAVAHLLARLHEVNLRIAGPNMITGVEGRKEAPEQTHLNHILQCTNEDLERCHSVLTEICAALGLEK